jgi:transmembrane sensor
MEMTSPRAREQAIDWLIRQRDPAFSDWEPFTEWLEADPANNAAYSELAAREETLAERLAETAAPADPFVQDNQPSSRPLYRRPWAAGLTGIAASAAALFLFVGLGQDRSMYEVSTRPGIQQTVTLAGGTTIELNGATRLTLDRDDPRFAELHKGEAVFAVVHDDKRPFRVEVDGAELVDLGTRFTVLREGKVTEVAVSEGLVMYNPGSEAIRLPAGRRLRATDGDPTIQLAEVAPDAVGGWASGRLVYDNVPLATVAADLSRTLGIAVRADPSVAGRPVTAVIQLPEDRTRLPVELEKLLDIKVRRTDSDWILTKS